MFPLPITDNDKKFMLNGSELNIGTIDFNQNEIIKNVDFPINTSELLATKTLEIDVKIDKRSLSYLFSLNKDTKLIYLSKHKKKRIRKKNINRLLKKGYKIYY